MAIELITAILNKEFEELKESLGNNNSSEKMDIIDKSGDILIPINVNKSISTLKNEYKNYIDFDYEIIGDEDGEYIHYNTFMNEYIDNKVKIAKNLDLINFMKIFTKELFTNELFYGCLITDGKDFFLNITHPLVLKYLKDTEYKTLPKKFIAMFFYINPSEKKEIDKDIYKNAMQRHVFFTCYYNYKTEDVVSKIRIVDERKKMDKDIFNLDDYIEVERVLDIKNILTPVQIYTKGEMIPAYGYVFHDENAKSFTSVDFMTGNISDLGSWNLSTSGGTLCTGDYNKVTLAGWRTINKCNINSMYFSYIINRKTWYESFKAALDIDKMILQNQEQPLFCQPTNADE